MKKILLILFLISLGQIYCQNHNFEEEDQKLVSDWSDKFVKHLTKKEFEGVLRYIIGEKKIQQMHSENIDKMLVLSEEEYTALSRDTKNAAKEFMKAVLKKENELLDEDKDIRLINKKLIDFINLFVKKAQQYKNKQTS